MLGLKESIENVLIKNGIDTIGKVIDCWYNMLDIDNLGITKLKHIHAATFAYLMRNNYVKRCKLVNNEI